MRITYICHSIHKCCYCEPHLLESAVSFSQGRPIFYNQFRKRLKFSILVNEDIGPSVFTTGYYLTCRSSSVFILTNSGVPRECGAVSRRATLPGVGAAFGRMKKRRKTERKEDHGKREKNKDLIIISSRPFYNAFRILPFMSIFTFYLQFQL